MGFQRAFITLNNKEVEIMNTQKPASGATGKGTNWLLIVLGVVVLAAAAQRAA